MIRCSCLKTHPDHEFQSGPMPQICTVCSHGIGLHIRQSPADQLVRLIGLHDITGWQISVGDGGALDVSLHLTPRGGS